MGPESFFCTPVPNQMNQGHAGPSRGLGHPAVVLEALGTAASSSGVTGSAGDVGLGPMCGSAGVPHLFPGSSWVLCCLCITAHAVISLMCCAPLCHAIHAMPCVLCIHTVPAILGYPCHTTCAVLPDPCQ